MIAELLTPLILSTAPAIGEVDTTSKYNHEKQVIEARLDDKAVGFTGMGTQTYMADGRPFDADND